MRDIWVDAQIDSDTLAERIAENDNAVEFVLLIDAYVADSSFTEELISRLQERLEEESD